MDIQSYLQNLADLDLIKNFDFGSFFDKDYLFDKNPFNDFSFAPHMILIAILVLIAGAILWLIGMRKEIQPVKAFYKRLAWMLWGLAVYAGLYVFFRVELVAVFSMRFSMVLWVVLFIAFFVYTIYYYKFRLPKRIDEYWGAKTRAKYMPKKKK